MADDQAPHEPPISKIELFELVKPLITSMKRPAGVRLDDMLEGYWLALSGCRRAAIDAAMRRFMAGETELKKGFCPSPPEFGSLVRGVEQQPAERPKRRILRYRRPASPILERNVTKAWAMRLLDGGQAPHGAIWCPGPLNDHPEYGDLFAPDPAWKAAVPIDAEPDEREAFVEDDTTAKDRVQRLLAETGHRIWKNGQVVEPRAPPEPEKPQPRQVPDFSGEKLEITPALEKVLKRQAEDNQLPFEDGGR